MQSEQPWNDSVAPSHSSVMLALMSVQYSSIVETARHTSGVTHPHHPPTCILLPAAVIPGVQLRVRHRLSQLMSQDRGHCISTKGASDALGLAAAAAWALGGCRHMLAVHGQNSHLSVGAPSCGIKPSDSSQAMIACCCKSSHPHVSCPCCKPPFRQL
jgi:hypothetical protein